jgi:hypothetical protein
VLVVNVQRRYKFVCGTIDVVGGRSRCSARGLSVDAHDTWVDTQVIDVD